MKFFALYLAFLKATATTFAGLASLPVVREELVVQRHWVTDHQLAAAIVVTRTTPGPVGLYVVSVGYFADGVLGALAGALAMITPALAIVLLLRFIGPYAKHPRVRGVLQAVVLASAGLLVASAAPLARDALVDPLTVAVAVIGTVVLLWKKIDTLWVIGGGALLALVAGVLGVG